jgi:pimeloyl-ACP methyl ester carboxylesterase
VNVEVEARFGRIHGWQHGPADGPLVLGLHGLTGSCAQTARIGARLANDGHRFVALDLRGRGTSDWTPAGTYGWANHALDVIAVADDLGAGRFAVVGVSMGGSVAMKVAELAGDRLTAVVLVDVAGRVDRGVGPVIAELLAAADPTTADPVAVAEDRADSGAQHPYDRWRHLSMPTLLVRAAQEIGPGAGYVVPAADRDAFLAAVPAATVVEVDASHRTVADHGATVETIAEFFTLLEEPRSVDSGSALRMTEPTQQRLDDLDEKIAEVTRRAKEHGTIESDPEPEPTIVDPDADGEAEGTGAAPPG